MDEDTAAKLGIQAAECRTAHSGGTTSQSQVGSVLSFNSHQRMEYIA